MIKREEAKITLITTTDLLGSSPSTDPAKEYKKQEAHKELKRLEKQLNKRSITAEEEEIIRERIEQILLDLEEQGIDLNSDKQITIFPRDEEGRLCILHHQLLGLLKETAYNFAKEKNIKNLISRYVKIEPRVIPLKRDGQYIYEPDRLFSRPLRGITPSGVIVSIATSELLQPELEISFTVKVANLEGMNLDKVINLFEIASEWGGLLQWRTGGYGKFRVEAVEEIDVETKKNNVKA